MVDVFPSSRNAPTCCSSPCHKASSVPAGRSGLMRSDSRCSTAAKSPCTTCVTISCALSIVHPSDDKAASAGFLHSLSSTEHTQQMSQEYQKEITQQQA